MGWTGYYATEYKKGQIDRRAECRKYFERNEKWGTLLKDAMVGSTWYGAVRLTSTGEVFGMVMRTSVNKREFCYKELSETSGPAYYDCPESILKLLSPTEDEYALKWREACRERVVLKEKLRTAQIIDVLYLYDTVWHKEGDIQRLFKWNYGKRGIWVNCPQDNFHYPCYRVSPQLLHSQNITIIE